MLNLTWLLKKAATSSSCVSFCPDSYAKQHTGICLGPHFPSPWLHTYAQTWPHSLS